MIKKVVLFSIFCTAIFASLLLSEEKHITWVPTPEERTKSYPWIPGPGEVAIRGDAVGMPLGRILLVRNGEKYCVLKFTDTWIGKTKYDRLTSYQFHYQGDGSGDFSKNTVIFGEDQLYLPKAESFLGFGYMKGAKTIITCGEVKLTWFYIADVAFRDTDNELAPTPWTSIKDVNVHDPRIKWYKKDSDRKRMFVPIDRLWDKPVDEKKQPAGGVESAQTGSK